MQVQRGVAQRANEVIEWQVWVQYLFSNEGRQSISCKTARRAESGKVIDAAVVVIKNREVVNMQTEVAGHHHSQLVRLKSTDLSSSDNKNATSMYFTRPNQDIC